MSRRYDPRQGDLEAALAAALHLAADAVEPGSDGLERIRSKISARQSARRAGWRALVAAAERRLAGLRLGPLAAWLRYLQGAVVERFRPDPARAGRFGWLRPAAAVATGVFVVAAASWAITGLPQAVKPATNFTGLGGGHGGHRSVPVPSGPTRQRTGPGTPGSSPTNYGGPSPSPSCSQGGGPQGSSPTASPSQSPSGSVSQSPSASPTSPAPSPTGTGTPSASPSATTAASSAPSSAASSAGPAGGSAGIVTALLASPVPVTAGPSPTAPAAQSTTPSSSPAPPAASPSPTPSPSGSSGSCGS